MIERLLRATAVGIALAALVDPPVQLNARFHPRIAVAVPHAADATGTQVRDRLARDLRADFDVVSGPDPEAAATVVIGDRYPEAPLPLSQRTSTVTIGAESGGARIMAVDAPRAVPRGTRIQLEIDLVGGAAGSTSVVSVAAGSMGHADVVVARGSHQWAAGIPRVSLKLDAVPLDLPPWRLRVRLADASQPAVVTSSHDLLVEEAAPLPVLFFEPRPSWIATFVRRALERDPRFVVSGIDYPTRGIHISIGDAGALDPQALRAASAIVVGGLDGLSAADRDLLDRFVRVRGGSLILLPDAPIGASPAREWLSGIDTREVLLERPAALSVEAPLPAVQASELLVFGGAKVPGAKVLARASGSSAAVVTVMPHGAGRLLWSGALDAWRYRAENDTAFDRFWRSAIAGLALATPSPVDVEITPAVVTPGESARVVARIHRDAIAGAPAGPMRVSARLDSGEPLRLWPEAGDGVFSGSFVADGPTLRRITVTADDEASKASGAALVAVDPTARHVEPIVPPLALLATSRGGINVTPEHLGDLESWLRREVTAPPVRSTRHPMRSAWWMVPFAACLGGEWWLRRRRGLR